MITIIIIAVTVLVSFSAFNSQELMYKCILNPYVTIRNKQWHRVVSHGFLHADYVHLLVNMIVLYSFGRNVEFIFKDLQKSNIISNYTLTFLMLYVGGLIVASLPSFIKHRNNPGYNSLGASGAVSAVTFTSIFFFPKDNIYLYFAIPIPAYIFGALYLFFEHYMSRKKSGNIAHDAHFAGAVYGFLFPLLIDPNLIMVFIDNFRS